MKVLFDNIKINASSMRFINNHCLEIAIFSHCSSIETLDISSFDTHKIKDMERMFYNCSSLKTLDLSSFDTRNVESMERMFKGCKSLKEVKLPKDKDSRDKILEQLKKSNIQCETI